MKWFSKDKKITQGNGIVGVYETEKNISLAYTQNTGKSEVEVKGFRFESVEHLTEKQAVIKNFVSEYGLQETPCSYVLQSSDYLLNLINTPNVPKGERNQAIHWLVRELVSFPIEESVIDSFELALPRALDKVNLSYATVMKREHIARIESLVNPSGLKLARIDIPELSLKNIAILSPENSKGFVFLNLSDSAGKILIVKDNNIFFARNMDINVAQFQQSPETQTMVLEQIIVEIQRTQDYASRMFGQNLATSVVLAPTQLDKNLIEKKLHESLGIPISSLNLNEVMHFERPAEETQQSECLLAIGTTLANQVA